MADPTDMSSAIDPGYFYGDLQNRHHPVQLQQRPPQRQPQYPMTYVQHHFAQQNTAAASVTSTLHPFSFALTSQTVTTSRAGQCENREKKKQVLKTTEKETCSLSRKNEKPTDKGILNYSSKNNRYNSSDIAPYYIFVENVDKSNKNLHPMSVGKLLCQQHPTCKQDIINISTVGRNRLKIETKTSSIANQLVQSSIFENNNLEAYIPGSLVHRNGIIRHVDVTLSEEELCENIQSEFQVVKIRRFTKKYTGSQETNKVPIPVCLILFRSQQLPDCVIIHGTRCIVEPFIPNVIQCHNCLRYGHRIPQCRSNVRCNKCGGPHEAGDCSDVLEPRCIYCYGNHYSTDKNCPEYIKQRGIKILMACNNVPFDQALLLYTNRKFSPAQSTFTLNTDEFPSLPTPFVTPNFMDLNATSPVPIRTQPRLKQHVKNSSADSTRIRNQVLSNQSQFPNGYQSSFIPQPLQVTPYPSQLIRSTTRNDLLIDRLFNFAMLISKRTTERVFTPDEIRKMIIALLATTSGEN